MAEKLIFKTMTHRIPFNYDLYLTGKYRAVFRDEDIEIEGIDISPAPTDFYKYDVHTNAVTFFVSESGGLSLTGDEDEFDVFLEPIPQPFHLLAALKGANLITRDGRDVRNFKANPDQAGPKAYIAMVGDDLIYYNEHGCVNYSCEPHPLDLFIKIN